MSVIIQGAQLRTIAFGQQVTKSAQALPQTATGNLYTVAGGNVLVTGLIGVVSTVIQNQACTLALGTTPTTGTAANTGISTATSIIAMEAGTWVAAVAASTGKAGALAVSGTAGAIVFLSTPFVVAPGTITWTTSASNTGAISWYLTYVPLDTGASVS